MTPEQARELFSAAHDGELDATTQAALDAALAADPALAEEYAAFGRMLAWTRGAQNKAAPHATAPHAAGPDLLPRVQRALRERSRGRFYADRFAERQGAAGVRPWLLAATLLLLLCAAWAALQWLGVQP